MSSIVLKGRWHGQRFTPDRRFEGTVEDAGDSALLGGSVVTVTHQAAQHTAEGNATQEHGHYSLQGMPGEDFILTSFLSTDDPHRATDGEDQTDRLWRGELFLARTDSARA